MVAVAVARGCHRVDHIHLITSRNERGDPQSAFGFDADHDLVGFPGVAGQHLMELTDSGESLGQSTRCQPHPRVVHQMDDVVILSPIVTDKDHVSTSLTDRTPFEPKGTPRRANGSVLNGTTSHRCYRNPHQPAGA